MLQIGLVKYKELPNMYIQLTFTRCHGVICLSDPNYVEPIAYTLSTPKIIDSLPVNSEINTMIQDEDDQYNTHFYLDCMGLGRNAIEDVIQSFASEKFERIILGGHYTHYTSPIISDLNESGMSFINALRKEIVKPKLELAANKYTSNNNTLFAAAGAVAITAVAVYAAKNKIF
tara:strand:- start:653 stop:1174 length:522 start_codon:yes stop_codon:yes gene_type:complete